MSYKINDKEDWEVGHFKDNKYSLGMAIEYLEKHNG